MDSLLNEMKLDFKRGQKIRFHDKDGMLHAGTYVMASSYADHIVVSMGGRHGIPAVVPVSKIVPKTNYGQLTVNALKRMK